MSGSSQGLKGNPLGLASVVALHGVLLYGMWSYHYAPAQDQTATLMVDLVNPAPQEQPKPEVPPPPKKTIEPPKPQQLVAEAPVIQPDEPVAPPPLPEPPPPVAVAPQMPPQPVMLSGELAVSCPDRSAPHYPRMSVRLNEQGKALLRVELDEVGRIANAEIKVGSGYSRLDEAALDAVKAWHCKPTMRNGTAVRAVALQPFNFILEGR